MSNIKDFKKIADEIMSDIQVSKALKERTLMKCTKKRPLRINSVLIPAACFVLILGTIGMSGLLSNKPRTVDPGSGDVNIMMVPEGVQTLPEGNEHNASLEPGKIEDWTYEKLGDAKNSFGDSFLIPSFIPQSFQLDKIYASGAKENEASKVVVTYMNGDKPLIIIEEKTDIKSGLMNFRTIDINGTIGYSKPGTSDSTGILDAEIHWFKGGTHYSVSGLLTEDEAIKIARSMK